MPAVANCESLIVGKTVYASVLDENLSSRSESLSQALPSQEGSLWGELNEGKGVLSTLVTLTVTTITIAVAVAVATVIFTLIGAGSDAVSAQVSREGIFAESAGIHNPYDKVTAPVRVYNCFFQVAAAAYVRWSVARCAVEKQVRYGLTPYTAVTPWG